MKKGLKGNIPSPFDATAHKTERSGAAVLMHWMREIIQQDGLDLGMPDVETSGADRKMPDVVIHETRRSEPVLCVIEAKPPYFNVFHEEELKEPARKKANNRHAPYFALTNFKTLVWFKTKEVNDPATREEDQIVQKYSLSQVEDLNDLEQTRYREPARRALRTFLRDLHEVSSGTRTEPKLPVDDLLVFRLHEKIRVLAHYYTDIIEDQFHKDDRFREQILTWFAGQCWSFIAQRKDFEKAARQAAYLLVNKILFYEALQAKRPQQLDPLEIPGSLTKGSRLRDTLEGYFREVLKIDYETVYTADFIDAVAFPDAAEVVTEVRELVNVLTRRYNFATLGYDIIGRIFERLIPEDERHNLGQYFTSPDVVDLILRFCHTHEDQKVLDPACGAGTFLVRAYEHKKLMNHRLEHEQIPDALWGNDIAKFPAHLATINLAIKGLDVDRNYPNILQEDFFALHVGNEGFEAEDWRKRRARTLGVTDRGVNYPRWFDVIVGNPPYTRQEEIPEIGVDKESLIRSALKIGNGQIAEISKRAGIHAYFFVHGWKFLKDGGHFGFIVSNSWLDVDYGKGIQEFFLRNYKIVAIIESKVERWFEEADVNTCIVLLQKCKAAQQRDRNLVRFVYLKKPLRHFMPPTSERWDEQLGRLRAIDDLKKTVLVHDDLYENDDLRIFPKSQKVLWDEGIDAEEGKYVGAKWGKYLRAPDIFFTILEKGKGKLVPLKEVAEVRRGYIPWPYEVFRIKKAQAQSTGIPKRYLVDVLSSPSEYGKIALDDKARLPCSMLLVDRPLSRLKERGLLNYLRNAREGVERAKDNPEDWFVLQKRRPCQVIWPRTPYDRHIVFLNEKGVSVIDHVEISTTRQARTVIAAALNSTLYALFREPFGRSVLGQGTLKTEVIDVRVLPIPPLAELDRCKAVLHRTLMKIGKREIGNVGEELGASSPDEVTLDTVKPDRRELDRIVMGDILGLTDQEQLEVYRAVLDLVKSRLARAKSVRKMKKGGGIDVEAAKNSVLERVDEETEE